MSTPAPVSDGISVAAIRTFYEEHVKDKMNEDCTTADILPVVKSLTKATLGDGSGLSYCQLLKQQAALSTLTTSDEQVGKATVFISHAWKYKFYDFLSALEARFKACEKLWIDNFCHNQHEDLTSDDWITRFEQHIKQINNTVMIVFPWDKPIPFTRSAHTHTLTHHSLTHSLTHALTHSYFLYIINILTIRAWCLLEVFYNTKNEVPFEVYLADEQRGKFLELVQENPGKAMLIFSRISTRQSTCWVMNDQLRIHSLIESSVGFDAVDSQVREAIAKALQVGGQTPHQPSLLSTQQNHVEGNTETVSVAVTDEKKNLLVCFLRDNDILVESKKAPSSIIEITLRYYE